MLHWERQAGGFQAAVQSMSLANNEFQNYSSINTGNQRFQNNKQIHHLSYKDGEEIFLKSCRPQAYLSLQLNGLSLCQETIQGNFQLSQTGFIQSLTMQNINKYMHTNEHKIQILNTNFENHRT